MAEYFVCNDIDIIFAPGTSDKLLNRCIYMENIVYKILVKRIL
jgi:hypothetical protein